MKIEIVTTKNERLNETGFGTFNACNSVLGAIERMGYAVKLNICKTEKDLKSVVARSPDLVVLAVKYISDEDGVDICLADYFSRHKINFTGSSKEILKYDSNKVLAKCYLMNKGIATGKYFTAVPGQYKSENDLPIEFPLFLKPMDAANGNGIDDLSYVNDFCEYKRKILSLYHSFSHPVLVEEYLDGREFTVAIIRAPSNELVIAAIEIVPPLSANGLRISGKKAKKANTEMLLKIKDCALKNRIEQLAIDVFLSLNARDFGRIDIKTNKSGDCFFIEVNLVPGMTCDSSYFPRAYEIENNLTYDEVVQMMLGNGLSRIPAKVSQSDYQKRHITGAPVFVENDI